MLISDGQAAICRDLQMFSGLLVHHIFVVIIYISGN